MEVAQAPKTVGSLAREAGVNVETIRYYERRGILKAPSRGSSGWRRYGNDALRTILFVKRAQRLGFTLEEIRDLRAMRRALARLSEQCHPDDAGGCPVLDALVKGPNDD